MIINDFFKILYEKMFSPDYVICAIPSFRCNYQCPYCVLHNTKFSPKETEINWQNWSNALNQFPPSSLAITGGEPFLYSGLLNLLKNLDKKHTVEIYTNLSFPQKLIRAKKFRKDMRVFVSFHPHMINLDSFKSKVDKLIDFGIEPTVNVVAKPDIIPKLSNYENFFQEMGLDFHVIPMVKPKFGGKRIKMIYQYEENNREKLKKYLNDREKALLKAQKSDYESTDCIGGYKYFLIAPNGDVYRCYTEFLKDKLNQSKENKEDRKFNLGNIFKNFKPLKKPEPCSLPCSCEADLHAREINKDFIKRLLG